MTPKSIEVLSHNVVIPYDIVPKLISETLN